MTGLGVFAVCITEDKYNATGKGLAGRMSPPPKPFWIAHNFHRLNPKSYFLPVLSARAMSQQFGKQVHSVSQYLRQCVYLGSMALEKHMWTRNTLLIMQYSKHICKITYTCIRNVCRITNTKRCNIFVFITRHTCAYSNTKSTYQYKMWTPIVLTTFTSKIPHCIIHLECSFKLYEMTCKY